MYNLGPQAQGINATRIGNRNGLDANVKPIPKPKPKPKPKPIPKPREICPRFPASMKTYAYNGSIRNRNSNGTALGTDVKTNVTPTKKRSVIPSAIPHSNLSIGSRTNSQTTSNSATSSSRSINIVRNRPQTAKSNPKPTAV